MRLEVTPQNVILAQCRSLAGFGATPVYKVRPDHTAGIAPTMKHHLSKLESRLSVT